MWINNRIFSAVFAWVFSACILASAAPYDIAFAQVRQPALQESPVTVDLPVYLPFVKKSLPADSLFGIEMDSELANSNTGAPAQQMAAAGANWVRYNGLRWSVVEPSPGVRNWDPLVDKAMLNARKNNLTPILIVRSTPLWAQLKNNFCGPIKPDALDDFGRFMRDVVTRYSGYPYYVKYYEMWNEPDIEATWFTGDNTFGCWGDTNDPYYGGGYYAEMLKAVYPEMKQANAGAQVLVGGLLLYCNPNNPPPNNNDGCKPAKFLQGILSNNGGHYFDGVSFHSYDYFSEPVDMHNPTSGLGVYNNTNWLTAWNTTGPTVVEKVDYLRGVLSHYGFSSKYLMNTEVAVVCGADNVDDLHCNAKYQTSSSYQNTKAYFLVQSYAVSRWLALKANIWFSYFGWRDSGMYSGDTEELQPVYSAFDFARQRLNWTYAASEVVTVAGVKGYQFRRFDKRVWILWYVGGDPNNGALTRSVQLTVIPSGVWKWVNSGSGLPGEGSYQPGSPSQTIAVGRAPVFIEFPP